MVRSTMVIPLSMATYRGFMPIVLGVLAGCAFEPMFVPENLTCTDNRGCPPGHQCVPAEGKTAGVCCSNPDSADCRKRAAAAKGTDAELAPRADAFMGSGGAGGAGGAPAEDVPSGGAGAGGASGAGGRTEQIGAGGTSADATQSSGGMASGGAGGSGGTGTGDVGMSTRVTLNKPATANSNSGDAWKGNDGQTDTTFCPSNTALPVEWTVDLGTNIEVTSTMVRFQKPDAVYSYHVESSLAEGGPWTMLFKPRSTTRLDASVDASMGVAVVFQPTVARYLRLVITDITPAGLACFSEFLATGAAVAKDGGR